MYDYLIVGAGFFGATFAERAKAAGKRVLVIDQRDHIGGNCFTKQVEGINVHWYGPHIFHTSNKAVWDYVNSFAEFNNFVNRVKVYYNDRLFSFPINLFTLYQLWGVRTPEEAEHKLEEVRLSYPCPRNMEEWCLANLGEEIYETFFLGYTTKHWRMPPSELPVSIIKRLPVRLTHDDNYYNHLYQGVPKGGYTPIFEKMLDGVEVKLNTELEPDWRNYAKKMVYSGRPDSLLQFKYGELPYLTLRFDHQIHDGDFQGNAIVNYTSLDVPFTRSVEHKHFEFGNQPKTVVTKEYPVEWQQNSIPYYPLPGHDEVYDLYRKEIAQGGDIILGGRLGRYRYFDMHQVIASALSEAKSEFGC